MRRFVTAGTCVVNLFAKGILVTGSPHAKLIAAKPYAAKSIVKLKLQPIMSLQGHGPLQSYDIFRQAGKCFLGGSI